MMKVPRGRADRVACANRSLHELSASNRFGMRRSILERIFTWRRPKRRVRMGVSAHLTDARVPRDARGNTCSTRGKKRREHQHPYLASLNGARQTSLGQPGVCEVLPKVALWLATSALLLVGCSDSAPPETETPVAPSPSESSASPAPSIPAYLAKLEPDERKAYRDARRGYERFAARQAELYEAGEAATDAKAFYERATADWQSYWAKLQNFSQQGYQTEGRGKTLRTRPAAIRLDDDGGGQVDLRVCSIARGVQVQQNGTPVPQPSPKPTLVTVRMVQIPDETTWRVLFEMVGSRC